MNGLGRRYLADTLVEKQHQEVHSAGLLLVNATIGLTRFYENFIHLIQA